MRVLLLACVLAVGSAGIAQAQKTHPVDKFPTPAGELAITFIGHGSLMITFGKTVVHIDPITAQGDYSTLPKADILLVTHAHPDHLDAKAIEAVRTPKTVVILAPGCANKGVEGQVMNNGDQKTVEGIGIEAVPAYNLVHMRAPGQAYHPKGEGDGYILTWGGKRIYVAGDTENTPEMKALKNIDIAFLPMNLPYTMTPEMVADAAKAFKPKVLYPYHTGDTDVSKLAPLLADEKGIEVRIRPMK